MAQPYTRRQLLILAVFTISGFTGLIYESIWSHYLRLFLGHAAYAQTLVLSIFMGGMAIGAWLVGRFTARIPQLLIGYAIVEALIGLLGLGFHPLFAGFLDWSFESAIPAFGSSFPVTIFKWSAAAALILPQSILLGMTFPLISGGLTRLAPERSGESLAMLYFTNCLGAAVGVLTSGFVLIERFGLPGTLMTAALLNCVLALVVWFIGRSTSETRPETTAPSASGSTPVIRWLIAAALLTGVASFLYEMAWIRMLSLVLGSSTHSFELMLAAFIFGLAFGGLYIRRRIDRIADPVLFLSRLLFLMAALGALTLPAYHYTFDVIAWAMTAFAPTESGYAGFNVVSQSIAMMIMLPVTFCAGMTLPLITLVLLRERMGERAIGHVYALNTVGAIAGVLAAIHLLMPNVGLKGTVLCAALLQAGVALAAQRLRSSGLLRIATPALGGASLLVLCLVAVSVQLDPRRMTAGVYRSGRIEHPAGAEVMYLRDGKTATISLVRAGGIVSIATNGKPDANIQMGPGQPAADEITMVMAGALPLAMHPNPARVANIGFGSGLTSQVLLGSERVQSLTSIEIEPFMVEAAALAYRPRIAGVFEDPRSHIVIEDAKTYFSSSSAKYDVIVSEPSNPWVSGVATLFSAEFYRRVRRYLAEDGLLVQWLQIYETDLAVVASVMKALASSFHDYQIFNVDDSNILIVATNGERMPELRNEIFENEVLAHHLERVGILGLEDLTTRRIGNRRLLGNFFASFPAPANSDFFPYVDLNAPRYRFMKRDAIALPELSFLSVPVLELAIPEWRTLVPERTPDASWGAREELVARAGLIAAGVASSHLEWLPGAIAKSASLLGVAGESCGEDGNAEAWLSAAREISRLTTAYLPPAELEPMWQRIVESECYPHLSAGARRHVDFLHAVAMRERSRIAEFGVALLRDGPAGIPSKDWLYLVTATAAAQVGLDEKPKAHAVLSAYGHDLEADDEYSLAGRVLISAVGADEIVPARQVARSGY